MKKVIYCHGEKEEYVTIVCVLSLNFGNYSTPNQEIFSKLNFDILQADIASQAKFVSTRQN